MTFADRYKDYSGEVYQTFFDCYNEDLTSLKGSPYKVMAWFKCSDNKLTDLEYAPQIVFGNFSCARNAIKTLKGGPQEVNGDYVCANNKLTSLEGSPRKVVGDFNASFNNLKSLKGAPNEIGGFFTCEGNPKLKNVRDEIINNNIRAVIYNTDEGNFTYEDFKDHFHKKDMGNRVTRPSMRKLLGLDK